MNDLVLLASQVGASERTLRRAIEEGALRGHRPSPRRLKLSAAEKDYALRRWSLLGGLRAALRTEPNVRFALLFGSAARGEDTPESDIDLLVEMRDPSLVRLVDLELKLEALFGREVDVLALEEAEDNPLLIAEAAREGRVLVDRVGRRAKLDAQATKARRHADRRLHEQGQQALVAIERLLAESS
jgi:predicted nucleotidyltransferase